MALIHPFTLRLMLKDFQSSFWACLLGTPTWQRLKSLFCYLYHANNSLNCARIATVCRMRLVCEKTLLGRNKFLWDYWAKAYLPITRNKPMESGLTRRAGRYIDPRDHRCSSRVAGALEIFGGLLNRGWRPTSPVCDGTAPHRLVSLYRRVGGRCGARTNQRF